MRRPGRATPLRTQAELPIPSWLIPSWLLRWLLPKWIERTMPLLCGLSQALDQEPKLGDPLYRQWHNTPSVPMRVKEDADGFYRHARAQVRIA